MAKQTMAPAPSLVEQIEGLRAEIGKRREEVAQLERSAQDMAVSDSSGALDADARLFALRRLTARQTEGFNTLVEQRHQEQFRARDQEIDELVARKVVEAESLAAKLREAPRDYILAVNRLSAIRPERLTTSMPLQLSGYGLIHGRLPETASVPAEPDVYDRDISAGLQARIAQLGSGAAALKAHARGADYPGNLYVAQGFVELRGELPAFALDRFDLAEPEPAEPELVPMTN